MNITFWAHAIQALRFAINIMRRLKSENQPTSTTIVSELQACSKELAELVPAAESLNQDVDQGARGRREPQTPPTEETSEDER